MQAEDLAGVVHEAAADGEILKESSLRRVLRLYPKADRAALVVKEYRIRGLLERVRALWLRSRAVLEERNLREARARGLPCPAPRLASVEPGLLPRVGWLVLEDLGPGQTVERALPELPEASACALLARVGELARCALERGLEHRDLHLGNFYLTDSDRIHLLDVHAARFRRAPVAASPRLMRGLYLALPWPEQAPLRRALFAPLGVDPDPPMLPRLLERHLARRLRRCTRSSGAFVRHTDPAHGTWFQRRFFPGDPARWRAAVRAGNTLKGGRRGRVVVTEHGFAKLRDESAAVGHWLAAEALALRGIPHPPALALFADDDSERWWVLSARVPGRPLDELPEASPEELLAAADDLAASLARLHATGWRCRDLRGDNLCLDGGRVCFVDLDGVRACPSWRRRGAQAADLGRLLSWLRWQAPDPIAAMMPRLTRRFVTRYAQRLAALGAPSLPDSLARAIELRSQRWKRRHS